MRNYYGLRCSAKRVTKHKVTFSFVNGSATRNLHLITACGRSFPSKGKPKRNRAAQLAEQTSFAPNTETFSAVHNISVSYRSRLARSLGVSGGGAALSSLCRRFPGGDIMNLTSRRSPLSGLSFSLFFFLRRKKKRLLSTMQSKNLCHQSKIRN